MASIFTKIINGEIPSVKITENEFAIAFMDISPLRHGHVLVVPKIEVDELFDLNDGVLSELILFSKTIAKALKKTFNKRIGLTVVGLEVPHAHIHLIPISESNDLNFNQKKPQISKEEIMQIANTIIMNLNS